MKVLVAYDHPVLGSGLKRLSKAQAAIQLVGEVERSRDLAGMVDGLRPDLLLLGLDATGLDPAPISTAIQLDERDSGIQVAMLMVSDMAEYLNGSHWVGSSERSVEAISNRETQQNGRVPADLTKREKQVLGLIGKGCDNSEIAWVLSISKRTVETYVHRIYSKLGLKGRSHAVRYAVEHGLVEA